MSRRIGVLALQGGCASHGAALEDLGHQVVEVRDAGQLEAVDGLILPGGESTTHLKLIGRFGLAGPLNSFVESGRPVLATCAGLILSARNVTSPAQDSFGWLDVSVARNGWGRQVHSFEGAADLESTSETFGPLPLPLLFIRAPRLVEIGSEVDVIARYDGEPIMVRQGNVFGASFHPELTTDRRIHQHIFPDLEGATSTGGCAPYTPRHHRERPCEVVPNSGKLPGVTGPTKLSGIHGGHRPHSEHFGVIRIRSTPRFVG